MNCVLVPLLVVLLGVGLFMTPATSVSAQKVTLTFWSWRTEDIDAYEQFIEVFEAENPVFGCDLFRTEIRSTTPFWLRRCRPVPARTLSICGRTGDEALADAGFLMPLDDKIDELQNFESGRVAGATNRSDGQDVRMRLRIADGASALQRRIFEQLGLQEPTTWDEFLAVAGGIAESRLYPVCQRQQGRVDIGDVFRCRGTDVLRRLRVL